MSPTDKQSESPRLGSDLITLADHPRVELGDSKAYHTLPDGTMVPYHVIAFLGLTLESVKKRFDMEVDRVLRSAPADSVVYVRRVPQHELAGRFHMYSARFGIPDFDWRGIVTHLSGAMIPTVSYYKDQTWRRKKV